MISTTIWIFYSAIQQYEYLTALYFTALWMRTHWHGIYVHMHAVTPLRMYAPLNNNFKSRGCVTYIQHCKPICWCYKYMYARPSLWINVFYEIILNMKVRNTFCIVGWPCLFILFILLIGSACAEYLIMLPFFYTFIV